MTPFLPLLLLIASCGSGQPAQVAPDTASTVAELPLPQIPASLRTPKERAAYLMLHFWDALDSADTALIRNERFMEQNFVNFANLYQHADSSQWHEATRTFLAKVTADKAARSTVYGLMDTYLSDPGSPVRDDDVYIEFLTQWIGLPGLDSYELEEPKYRLAAALKNRPGTKAADFDFITTAGNAESLYSQKDEPILLLLYDPECDHCMEVIAKLRADDTLNFLIDKGKIKVLAVCVEGDRALWSRTSGEMPRNWTIGIDDSGILDEELYYISELPGIYLLKGDRTVVLRDPTPEKLETALSEL